MKQEIEQLLASGMNRRQAWKQLKKTHDPELAARELNNTALPAMRKKFMAVNLALGAVLFLLTWQKVSTALQLGIGIPFLVMMIVPAINMFLLQKIIRFQRNGYQLLLALSALSLVHAENRRMPELAMLVAIIVLSGVLAYFLFPKKEQLKMPAAKE